MNELVEVGSRYGRLVVLESQGSENGVRLWRCVCDCGVETTVKTASLRNGKTKSCGCLHRERLRESAIAANTKHGAWNTPEYQAWSGVRNRCLNPALKCYERYGGRGIQICDRWRDSFENFLADVGPKPSPEHSIERIDNEKHYTPDNCRWANRKEQANNRRSSRIVSIGGVSKTAKQWAEEKGVNYNTFIHRLDRGWDPQRALTG